MNEWDEPFPVSEDATIILERRIFKGPQNTDKLRESVFSLHFKFVYGKKKSGIVPSFSIFFFFSVRTRINLHIIEIILAFTHHAQRHPCPVNKIIKTTVLLVFFWSDEFTAKSPEESQTSI